MRDLRGLVGWPGAFVDGWGTARKLGQWCYSDLASSLASSGAASTCGTEGTEQGQTCVTNTPPSVQNPPSGGGGGESSPHWSWPRRSQSGSPRLPLPQHFPLPSWFSCPPSYRSQPFLSAGGENSVAARCVVENSHTRGRGLLPLLPSWPLVQAWAGPVSMTTIGKNQASATLIHHSLITSNFPVFPT